MLQDEGGKTAVDMAIGRSMVAGGRGGGWPVVGSLGILKMVQGGAAEIKVPQANQRVALTLGFGAMLAVALLPIGVASAAVPSTLTAEGALYGLAGTPVADGE